MFANCKLATIKLQDTVHVNVNLNASSYFNDTGSWQMIRKTKTKKQKIEEALYNGADINACSNSLKNTPLCDAISQNDRELIEFLINKGADLDSPTNSGDTPLTYCISNDFKDSVSYLVKAGANICQPNKNKKTPLSVAVLHNNISMVEFLLDNGADYNIQTAFLDAILSENIKITKFFITKGASVNFKYKHGYTPLIAAIEKRSLSIMDELFKHGVDVDALDNKGLSPLTLSIETRTNEILKKLLDRGANVNIPETNGTYPLVKSIEMNRFDMLQTIVEESKNPVDFSVINKCGHTALTKATAKQHFGMVKFIVEHGADVNQIDGNQKTPLSIAAINSDIRSFEFFIDSGANIDLAMPQIEEVARNDDDFSIYFQKLNKILEKMRIQSEIINLVGESGQEEA